jgi:hypothetical protein
MSDSALDPSDLSINAPKLCDVSFGLDLNWMELYLDDSGSRLPDQEPAQGHAGLMDCFALGGILFEARKIKPILKAYTTLCRKWHIDYPLVSNKIRMYTGRFAWVGKLSDSKRDEFFRDIACMIEEQPFFAIACVVHRPGYNARYHPLYGEKRWSLCKTTFTIVVERAVKLASRRGLFLRVHFERTGPREDKALIIYQRELKKIGMPFEPETSSIYRPLEAGTFRKTLIGDPLQHTKTSRLSQLADLVLYPMVKGKYDPDYRPYRHLRDTNKLIDRCLRPEDVNELGIKYSCFD